MSAIVAEESVTVLEDEIPQRRIPTFKGNMYFLPVYDENTDYRIEDRAIEGNTVYVSHIDNLTESTIADIEVKKVKRYYFPYEKGINPLEDTKRKIWKPVVKLPEEIPERKIIKVLFESVTGMITGGMPFENFKMSLNSKRIYNKNKHEICRDNNAVLNFTAIVTDTDKDGNKVKVHLNKKNEVAGDFMLRYLYLKMAIDNPATDFMVNNNHNMFLSELMNVIPKELVILTTLFVDKYYNGTLDAKIKTDHPYNMDTTFLDADIKQICIVKYLGNLLIPMCTHYCNLKPGLEDSIEFFIQFYKDLFKKICVMAEGETDALTKLHNLASSMVGSAYNQNNVIMKTFEIDGNTVESITDEIFSKILITKITAVDIERSNYIAPFITQIIRKASNDYAPRTNKGYDISKGFSDDVINSDSEDSVTSMAEKMESKMTRQDELVKIVRKVFADDNVHKIAKSYGVIINPDELNFIITNNIPHRFQTHFTFSLFCDRFSGYHNMYDINHIHYCMLVLIADNYLRKNGDNIVADFLTAKCESVSLSQRWGGKLSNKRLIEDPRYISLFDEKYKFIRAKLTENNFILNDITSLANSNFLYNRFGNPKNGTIISHTDEEIIDAVLDFYTLLD